MTATWLVLVPVCFLIARFYKVTPRQDWPKALDNPFWFVWHRRLGWIAILLTALAMAAIAFCNETPIGASRLHAWAGWTVLALGLFQVISALFRGTHGGPIDPFTRAKRAPEQWVGDHYCMTRRRILFEYSHKTAGYVVIFASVFAIVSGLAMVEAPRWMWLGLIVTCLACAIIFLRLQRQGRCVDTYQAIWGLDPTLPSNQRAKPIGWGIRRVSNADTNAG